MRKNFKKYTSINVLKTDLKEFQKLKLARAAEIGAQLSDSEFFAYIIKKIKERGKHGA